MTESRALRCGQASLGRSARDPIGRAGTQALYHVPALLSYEYAFPRHAGLHVVCTVSGRNIEPDEYEHALSHRPMTH